MRYNKYELKDKLNLNEDEYSDFIYTIMQEIDHIKAEREYKAELRKFWDAQRDAQKPIDEDAV